MKRLSKVYATRLDLIKNGFIVSCIRRLNEAFIFWWGYYNDYQWNIRVHVNVNWLNLFYIGTESFQKLWFVFMKTKQIQTLKNLSFRFMHCVYSPASVKNHKRLAVYFKLTAFSNYWTLHLKNANWTTYAHQLNAKLNLSLMYTRQVFPIFSM